jgi:hypothetical protein
MKKAPPLHFLDWQRSICLSTDPQKADRCPEKVDTEKSPIVLLNPALKKSPTQVQTKIV